MSNQDKLLAEFTEITGADTNNARFFLESSAWKLEVALTSFYESYGGTGSGHSGQNSGSDNECEEVGASATSSVVTQPIRVFERSREKSRIGTIAGLKSEDNSDNEDREAFYAGGSEHSGQQVLGPESSDEDIIRKRRDFIAQMIKSAHERGEMSDDDDTPRNPLDSLFSGVGYRLGQTSNDSTAVNSGGRNQSEEERREVVLKLWKSGFSVDDGPLREYKDPANFEFLSTIRRGQVPDELLSEARGGTVHMNMEDHRHENYNIARPKVKAFSGRGQVLGSPTPAVTSDEGDSQTSEVSNATPDLSQFKVNESCPVTTVQVRLTDGSVLKATLNHDHTIADLQKYIAMAAPRYQNMQFRLLTTYPPKELNEELTLVQAGILNSSILLRLK